MQVLLFGSIAEKAGSALLQVEASSVTMLRLELVQRIPELRSMRYAIAVDRMVITDDRELTGTEEIAVLPPFAGG